MTQITAFEIIPNGRWSPTLIDIRAAQKAKGRITFLTRIYGGPEPVRIPCTIIEVSCPDLADVPEEFVCCTVQAKVDGSAPKSFIITYNPADKRGVGMATS